MGKFVFVKIMSKEEKREFFDFVISRNETKKIKSERTVKENSEMLLSLYNEVDKIQSEINVVKKLEYNELVLLYNKKKCLCGNSLRFIDNYNFWGCPYYKDGGEHITFKSVAPTLYLSNEIASNWLGEIIRKSKLKGELREKELFEFYMRQTRIDLKLKYCGTPTKNHLYSYIKTNKTSKEFEKNCLEFLKSKYNKVEYQLGVKYKINEEKERKCFIDFVVSNKNSVIIYECKTNASDKDDVQKNLYISLINFLMRERKDHRGLSFEYLIEKNN